MIKRKKLGQHFLNSNNIANLIVSNAGITKQDIVFEIGTGLGILTPLLCENAKRVISIDADSSIYQGARSRLGDIDNLVLKLGDGFKNKDDFTIFVSNLPYSKSKDAFEWMAQRKFSHGVVMVQKEFADKLLAKSKNRRAVSIIANHTLEIQKILNVDKSNFTPPPKINSVVLKIIKKRTIDKKLVQTINKIFSYRRKTIQNIYKQFGKETTIDKRLDDLSVEEITDIAKEIQSL